MRTLTDDKTYLLIFAEAERIVARRLHAEPHRYDGNVASLIDDAVRDTAHALPLAVAETITGQDLRDVCLGAAHEGMVKFYRQGIA